jgi:hypothetical protein
VANLFLCQQYSHTSGFPARAVRPENALGSEGASNCGTALRTSSPRPPTCVVSNTAGAEEVTWKDANDVRAFVHAANCRWPWRNCHQQSTLPFVQQGFFDPNRSADNDIGALEYESFDVFCGGTTRENEEQGAGWSCEPKEGETARFGCAEGNWVKAECI